MKNMVWWLSVQDIILKRTFSSRKAVQETREYQSLNNPILSSLVIISLKAGLNVTTFSKDSILLFGPDCKDAATIKTVNVIKLSPKIQDQFW